MLNFIATDLQLYKTFKIMRVSFLRHTGSITAHHFRRRRDSNPQPTAHEPATVTNGYPPTRTAQL